jgi:hypothetical protein
MLDNKKELEKAQDTFNDRYEGDSPNYHLTFCQGIYLGNAGYSYTVATCIMNSWLKKWNYSLYGKYEKSFDDGYNLGSDNDTTSKLSTSNRPFTIEDIYNESGLTDNNKIYYRKTGIIEKKNISDKELIELYTVKSFISNDLVTREELLDHVETITRFIDGKPVDATILQGTSYVILDIDGDTELNRYFIKTIQNCHGRTDKPLIYTVNPNTTKSMSYHFIFKLDDNRQFYKIAGNGYDLLGNAADKQYTSFEKRRVTKTDKIILN